MSVRIRTAEMQRIEADRGRPIEEILRELYIDRGMTVEQVGIELGGLNKGAISRWLDRFDIPRRRPGPRAEVA